MSTCAISMRDLHDWPKLRRPVGRSVSMQLAVRTLSNVHRDPLAPTTFSSLHYIGVPTGVQSPPLPFGQGGDELAAEGGDVCDQVATDQVESGREKSRYVSEGPLW
jgi:hypothetical protein